MSAAEKIVNQVAERERTHRGTATVARLIKAGEGGVEIARNNVQRIVSAPFDRMVKDGKLTASERNAGEWYRATTYLAAVDPSTGAVNWDMAGNCGFSPKVPIMFSSQRVADARIELRRMEKAIRGIVATILWLALVKEKPLTEIGRSCFGQHNERDARAAGQAGVRVALAALANWLGG